MNRILGVASEGLVSIDYKGDPHSSVIGAPSKMVLSYSNRVVNLINYMASKGV